MALGACCIIWSCIFIFIGAELLLLSVEGDKAHYVCPVYALCMRIHDVWAQIKSSRNAWQHLYNNKSIVTF